MALISKARKYDKAPSQQEIKESVTTLQGFSQEQNMNDSFFSALCKAIFCASYQTEVEVDGTVYFWNLKKGLSVTESNDIRLWI
ncbi:hypothetical protein NG798_22660 [Ancylothrix sp. C2]|uniref:hypothetical protein n=1 Tax=Ancylothrix sp. D3o TaxID=2953691 RepID=UPI0021BA7134|nr:hypothetical protein [Ancylothrix sp. D3o]MCT7952603.1 hypothetical protein [Ancylothrix sp. D3o]